MALVGYFVQWVKEANGAPANMVPKLCRLVADSDYEMQKPSDFITDKVVASDAPATKASDYAGQLAENVLGLWMQPLDQQNKPISSDSKALPIPDGQFDSSKGYAVAFTRRVVTKYATALPASLEVALVAVDARTAKRLTGIEKPKARTADMWADVNAFYNSLPSTDQTGRPDLQHGDRPARRSPVRHYEIPQKSCCKAFGLRPDHDVGHRGSDYGCRRRISGQRDAGIEDRRLEPGSGACLRHSDDRSA